jgi:hypothetical protein
VEEEVVALADVAVEGIRQISPGRDDEGDGGMIPGVIPGIVVDAQASIRGAIRKGVAVDIVASTAGQFNMV